MDADMRGIDNGTPEGRLDWLARAIVACTDKSNPGYAAYTLVHAQDAEDIRGMLTELARLRAEVARLRGTMGDIEENLGALRLELASRIDDLGESGEIGPAVGDCLGGIGEGMASIEQAIRAAAGLDAGHDTGAAGREG